MEITWRDKYDVHNPSAHGNLCDEHGNGIKPTIYRTTIKVWNM
jgi:hypothetical protein